MHESFGLCCFLLVMTIIILGTLEDRKAEQDLEEEVEEEVLWDSRGVPSGNMTVPELIAYYGYIPEIHHVTTEDGYILELHRLLLKLPVNCAELDYEETSCNPVLLQHGLLGSSSAWVMNTPTRALGYILADRGHDVWMGNARGNIYSINHTHLETSSEQFWDFSFDEMGKYDIPAMIDYILEYTDHEKLSYVGHSMGTTMFWILQSERPAYANKVHSMAALGPVAYVGNILAPIRLLSPFTGELAWVLKHLHEYRFLNPSSVFLKLLEKPCFALHFTKQICEDGLFLLVGFDANDLDMNWLPIILEQLNAGTSTKTLIHFSQLVKSGQFTKYDYGSAGNQGYYNQSYAPAYSLAAVTSRLLLKWGHNDWLADPTDVAALKKQLTNAKVSSSPVENPHFNHLDFLWGKDAHNHLYPEVYRFIENQLNYLI